MHMKRRAFLFTSIGAAARAQDLPKPGHPRLSRQAGAVHRGPLNDVFWAPRIETNRVVTIPFAFQQCEQTGRLDNFVRAATALRGENAPNKKAPGYPFDDTDIYKVIEGAVLCAEPCGRIPSSMRMWTASSRRSRAAQEKDGYLYTTRTIDPQNPHPWAGKERWELEQR